MIFNHCVGFHLSCSYCQRLFTPVGWHRGEQSRSRRFILAKVKIFPQLSIVLSAAHRYRNSQNLQMNKGENEPVQRRGVREGTEESAKPLCLSCVIKQRKAQRAKHGQTCCQMHQMFLLHECGAPSPPPSVRSSLSYLIPSNLTTLHGRIINQVTNRASLCFRGTALFMPRLSSLRCSNVSYLFQDTCCQDNTRLLQQ